MDHLNVDKPNFSPDKYLEGILKQYSLKQIMDTEANIVKDTQTLHSDMQTLVYENYNKFISATDTIRKMKTDFKKMETDMKLLAMKMNTVTKFSDQITLSLQETRTQLCKLSEKHSLLKRLQFLSSLPSKLNTLIEAKNYSQAVQDYKHAQKFLEQYGEQPSFQGIRQDCESVITKLKQQLKADFQISGATVESLTETGELLLQLDEKPSDLAKEMLHYAAQRLHEQIIMLQDHTERDMIEFADLGVAGVLNDLTLVVSSYNDMFLTKELGNESNDFQDIALENLNEFIKKNMDKYMDLVQDRVELEIEDCDIQIMLRGLDRLHRRLLAMKNLYRCLDMNKTSIDIIISAANQLCDINTKHLKDNFFDNLNSIRLSLVSTKSDNSFINSTNINELVTTLYTSTVENVKNIIQELLVFLRSDWSFNIRTDSKGVLCIEGFRENMLIGFLKDTSSMMTSFSNRSLPISPNLFLVLSKFCLEMEHNGIHLLISMFDDIYEIDSENSTTLTHETEMCAGMRDSAQILLDCYVRMQGTNISHMLRKSIDARDWLNCLEPRSVRAVMKRVVEELSNIENIVAYLYESDAKTAASSDSSRKTHLSNITTTKAPYRSTWSNYTPTQIDSSYVSNIHRLFSERIEIFTSVGFSKISIMTGIIKIGLKTFLECVRLKTFSKFGLQQIQVDTHYLQMNLWRFVTDENLIHFLLDEILGSTVHRCLESTLMEPNAVEIICERS